MKSGRLCRSFQPRKPCLYFISKIGDDEFGSMATKIYEQAGVDYSKLIISPTHSTGAAGILVD